LIPPDIKKKKICNLGGFTLESPQGEYWKLLAVFKVRTRNIEKHFRKSYKAWKISVVYMWGKGMYGSKN
jgi:hypothetical protein